jgi:glycine cleavage system H protein
MNVLRLPPSVCRINLVNIPTDLQYLASHEWLRLEGDTATVGITDFAQDQLGDVVYVELPAVGKMVMVGDTVAVVESVKTASDIYTPVTGRILEVNTDLTENTEWVNESPFDKGWLFKVAVEEVSSDVMDAEEYQKVAEAEA